MSARICTRSFASRFESGSSIRYAFGARTIAAAHGDALPLAPGGAARACARELAVEAEELRRPRAPAGRARRGGRVPS